MAITAAEILTAVNGRLNRAEASIDTPLKGILHDLATRGLALEDEEQVTLVDEQPNYVFTGFTAKFQHIKNVVIIDSNSIPSRPLTEITWRQYKERLSGNFAAGEPDEYCIFPKIGAKTLYFSPKPDADSYPYARISGTLRHGDTTTISYNEEYRELLIYGCCWKVADYYNPESKQATRYSNLYEAEIIKIFGDTPSIGQVQYSDI